MFIQHLESLRYIQVLLTLILLRVCYLSESHTMIVILKQVVQGISEGTTNNDCHQNISQNRRSKSYLEHRGKNSTNLLLKSLGKIHPQLEFLSFGRGVKLNHL